MFRATVHYKKFKQPLVFFNLKDLYQKVENVERWMLLLKYADYTLMCEDSVSKALFKVDDDLAGVPEIDAKIVVVLKVKGFSTVAGRVAEALESIGCLYKEVAQIPKDTDGSTFPTCPDLSRDRLAASVDKVMHSLNDRLKVINISLATEYSMREFVSPILIELVILAAELWKSMPGNEKDSSKLSLACERIIVGKSAHGPVDYSILLDWIDFVLTEVKLKDMSAGIVQNLVQQAACKQFLANTVIPLSGDRETKKKKYEDAFDSVTSIASYGVATTGDRWVLSRCDRILSDGSFKTVVKLSEEFSIGINSERSINREKVSRLLSCLVQVLIVLMRDMRDKPNLKKFKNTMTEEHESTESILDKQVQDGQNFESVEDEEEAE